MPFQKIARWLLPVILLGGLSVLGVVAVQYAEHSLKAQIVQTLGPLSEVREIRVSTSGAEILGLRIKAPQRVENAGKPVVWPGEDQLRAERILIVPAWSTLFGSAPVLKSLRIENAEFTLLRPHVGKVKLLPALLGESGENAGTAPDQEKSAVTAPAGKSLLIERIELGNASIALHDATVRTPPHKLRAEQVEASIEPLRLPERSGMSKVNLHGVLKGVHQDGKISISGNIEFATLESGVTLQLRGADWPVLQPYLPKATESGVNKGAFDFELKSAIHQGQIKAPASLVLKGGELSSLSGTFMNLPRSAIAKLMKNRKGMMTLKFILEGDVDNPHFSLNEVLATRINASLADSLDLRLDGLVRDDSDAGDRAAKPAGRTRERKRRQ